MSRIYIKFQSEADEIKGYYALATRAKVDSLPGSIFGISSASLHILEEQEVQYALASQEEVTRAYEELRTSFSLKNGRPHNAKLRKRLEKSGKWRRHSQRANPD